MQLIKKKERFIVISSICPFFPSWLEKMVAKDGQEQQDINSMLWRTERHSFAIFETPTQSKMHLLLWVTETSVNNLFE